MRKESSKHIYAWTKKSCNLKSYWNKIVKKILKAKQTNKPNLIGYVIISQLHTKFIACSMLSMRWLTITESVNCHSSCTTVCNSGKGFGVGKCLQTVRLKPSHTFSMGLSFGEYDGYSIIALLSLSI